MKETLQTTQLKKQQVLDWLNVNHNVEDFDKIYRRLTDVFLPDDQKIPIRPRLGSNLASNEVVRKEYKAALSLFSKHLEDVRGIEEMLKAFYLEWLKDHLGLTEYNQRIETLIWNKAQEQSRTRGFEHLAESIKDLMRFVDDIYVW